MGSLLVITGPPGAGKSTAASLLVQRLDRSALIEGDRFFAFLAMGRIEPWLPAARSQNEVVTEAAARAAGRFASDYETVYDGVVGPWYIGEFARAASVPALDYVILLPPVELCVERVLTRRGHGFDDEAATRKMYDEFSGAEIDGRHVLGTVAGSAESTVAEIERARRNGRLRYEVGT